MPQNLDEKLLDGHPALHPRWKEDINFVGYTTVCKDDDQATVDEWLNRAGLIQNDLHLLLKFSHQQFWCQVIFDSSLHALFDSFLKAAPRPYEWTEVFGENGSLRKQYLRLHRLIFLTFLRMATHKESKDCTITPSVFGDILYENFLFDIPRIFDLCALYGNGGSSRLLSKMISNVFEQQPKYWDDLRASIEPTVSAFDVIKEKCGVRSSESPIRLASGLDSVELSGDHLEDMVNYFLDTTYTLNSLIQIFPGSSTVFMEADVFQKLASLYSSCAPLLRAHVTTGSAVLRMRINLACCSALSTVCLVIHHLFTRHFLEMSKEEDRGDVIERFLDFFSSLIAERSFISDLQVMYDIQDDLDAIKLSGYEVDGARVDYILQSLKEAARKKSTKSRTSAKEAETESIEPAVETHRLTDVGEGACAAPRPPAVEVESLICAIKDVLPDLGDGFLMRCFDVMGYDVEKVLHGLLEDKLPESLVTLDRTMPREDVGVSEPESNSILSQRHNVYDNDEFDIFSRDQIDMSKVHQGKRTDDVKKVFDDKSSLDKEFYRKFDVVHDEFDFGAEGWTAGGESTGDGRVDDALLARLDSHVSVDYDDEYDDTYDGLQVGASEAGTDELTARRQFTVPRVLQTRSGQASSPQSDESEEDENDESNQASSSFTPFVSDPAAIREKREQQYQARRGRGAARGGPPRSGGSRDVVGKTAGQGQEKNVVRNRAQKDRNKSSRANHNRRALADRKRATFK